MGNKNEVFEYLIDQLRQQLPVADVMGEIKRWSIDRSIAGRGNYTDEENAVIDAYIGLEHNPYTQQCEDLAHEVQSLKNQLRDASELVAELQSELQHQIDLAAGVYRWSTAHFDEKGKVFKVESGVKTEQSGCRKEDTQGCEHDWVLDEKGDYFICAKCGKQESELSDCQHANTVGLRKGFAPGFTKKCLDCGAKLK